MAGLYVALIVVVAVFAAVFVGFYVYRLIDARRALSAGRRRRRGGVAETSSSPQGAVETPVSGLRTARSGAELDSERVGAVRIHDGATGLRHVSSEPVFIRRNKAGDVTVQVESRPATPLKYILDARAKTVLDRVVREALRDYGDTWAVLAEEDDRGRLKLTRLA